MKKHYKFIADLVLTLLILGLTFVICHVLESSIDAEKVVPAIFTLAVFIVSYWTDGYFCGILMATLSVLVLNFAFTFPFFAFNFTIQENMISAVIMLIITIMSSTLTTKVKQQEKMKIEHEKERMRANLLRAVSHDLRTPLTTIYGSSAAIAEQYSQLSKEQLIQLANGIKEDSQWLMGMVENLLSITKIDNTGVKLIKTSTVLEELIDSVLIRFRKRYPNQKIVVDIPFDFISIPMDAVLIEQVLFNILENAVQHAIGMTQLKIRVFVDGDLAIFEISDDGCGIEKERLQDIFKGYFEKKEAPADNQKSSMGIGLSVCATIIKAHEGNIMVENQKEGGCCFRFSLQMGEDNDEQQI